MSLIVCSPSDELTDGIEICDWTVSDGEGAGLTYSVWDFAGQVVYYNTHQVSSEREQVQFHCVCVCVCHAVSGF